MKQYYIYDGQMKIGPFDLDQLKSQSLRKETPVWYEGLDNWAMAGNVDKLQELFTRKIMSPPSPKLFEKKMTCRNELLDSFTTAREILPEPNKKSSLVPVLVFFIVVGILLLL